MFLILASIKDAEAWKNNSFQKHGFTTDSGDLPKWKFLGLKGGHVVGGKGVRGSCNMSMCVHVSYCKCSNFLCSHIFSEMCYP